MQAVTAIIYERWKIKEMDSFTAKRQLEPAIPQKYETKRMVAPPFLRNFLERFI